MENENGNHGFPHPHKDLPAIPAKASPTIPTKASPVIPAQISPVIPAKAGIHNSAPIMKQPALYIMGKQSQGSTLHKRDQ